MARDPVALLARLRRIEMRRAQRHLAERLAMAGAAEARLAAAEDALPAEAAMDNAAAFGAWLPRALAERDRARLASGQARTLVEESRDVLAAAQVALRAVELFQARRSAAERLADLRREQAALDDLAGRRQGGGPGE